MPSEPCTDEEFRAMVAHLRAVAPVPRGCSVTVHRVADLADHGYTSKHRANFTIEVAAGMTHLETELTLIHEWAHMLAWRPHHPLSGDHGPDWGVWYALCYSRYHGVT